MSSGAARLSPALLFRPNNFLSASIRLQSKGLHRMNDLSFFSSSLATTRFSRAKETGMTPSRRLSRSILAITGIDRNSEIHPVICLWGTPIGSQIL